MGAVEWLAATPWANRTRAAWGLQRAADAPFVWTAPESQTPRLWLVSPCCGKSLQNSALLDEGYCHGCNWTHPALHGWTGGRVELGWLTSADAAREMLEYWLIEAWELSPLACELAISELTEALAGDMSPELRGLPLVSQDQFWAELETYL